MARVEFQAIYVGCMLGEAGHIFAHTAAVVQDNTRFAAICSSQDHAQTALLTGAPNVGWFAAQGGSFEVSFCQRIIPCMAKILLDPNFIDFLERQPERRHSTDLAKTTFRPTATCLLKLEPDDLLLLKITGIRLGDLPTSGC